MRRIVAIALAVLFALTGCSVGIGVGFPIGSNVSVSMEKKVWSGGDVEGEVVWSGNVKVEKPVRVKKGSTLKILPGTKVTFNIPEVDHKSGGHDHSDYENSWIYVEGKVEAVGEPERRIVFTSAVDASDKGAIDAFAVIEAQGVVISNAVFERCGWAVHMHDTPGAVFSDSVFRGSYGGIRFKGDGVAIRGNVFEGNKIGVRAIEAAGVTITRNEFRGNLTGIFFREGVRESVVSANLFADTEYDIKLGEEQKGDIDARGNRWEGPSPVPERIYDGADSEGIGRVIVEGAHGK